jgi:pimeloyl-ACP methyl ester carboxylesterase
MEAGGPRSAGLRLHRHAGPSGFRVHVAAYAQFLQRFADTLDLQRYVLWLHDYGSQFGLRLAMAAPERVAGLVVQNGDVYPEAFGPKYDFLMQAWTTRVHRPGARSPST